MGAPALPSGSHPSGQAAARPVASRFDPSRIAEILGPAQRRVILSLSEEWGKSCDHQCAKRIWYGVKGRGGLRLDRAVYLIDHKHRTDNCWRLNERGSAVRAAIATEAATAAETVEQGSVHEGAGRRHRPTPIPQITKP